MGCASLGFRYLSLVGRRLNRSLRALGVSTLGLMYGALEPSAEAASVPAPIAMVAPDLVADINWCWGNSNSPSSAGPYEIEPGVFRWQTSAHQCIENSAVALSKGKRSAAIRWIAACQQHNSESHDNILRNENRALRHAWSLARPGKPFPSDTPAPPKKPDKPLVCDALAFDHQETGKTVYRVERLGCAWLVTSEGERVLTRVKLNLSPGQRWSLTSDQGWACCT